MWQGLQIIFIKEALFREGFFFESLTTQLTSGYDYEKLFKSNSSLPQNSSVMAYLCGQPLGQEI